MAPIKAAVLCLAVLATHGLRHMEDLIDSLDIDHEAVMHHHKSSNQKAQVQAHRHKAHGKHRHKSHQKGKMSRRLQNFIKLANGPVVADMDSLMCPDVTPGSYDAQLEPGVTTLPQLMSCSLKSDPASVMDGRCCMRADIELTSKASCPEAMHPKTCVISARSDITSHFELGKLNPDFNCAGNLLVIDIATDQYVAVRFLDMHSIMSTTAGLPKLLSVKRDDDGAIELTMKGHDLNVQVYNSDGKSQKFQGGWKLMLTDPGKGMTLEAKYWYNQGLISKGFHFLTRSTYDGTGTYEFYPTRSVDVTTCQDKSARDNDAQDQYDMPLPTVDDDDWGSSSDDDDWGSHDRGHDDSFDNERDNDNDADSFDNEPADTSDNDADDTNDADDSNDYDFGYEGFTGDGV